MKRRFSFLLAIMVFVFGVFFLGEEGTVRAAAPNGIAGNGLAGININVNASPYTDFAKIPTWGQYAYGPSGCAWFASARVKQLTGKGDMIYSGPSWYNSAYSKYGFSRGSAMKAPALLCWQGHVAVLEKINGSTAYISEGGMSGYGSNASTGYTVIRAVPTSKLTSQNANFLGYVYFSATSRKPYYSSISVTFVDNWNAGLSGRIENPDRCKIDNVGVHIWDSAGNMVVNHKEAFGQATSYVNQGLNVVAEALSTGLRSGETYTFQMFAEFNGTSCSSSVGSFTCKDETKPAITDVKVYDVDENGYTVSCTATDNFKVDRVQFPTWTVANDQDDIVGGWSTDPKCSGSRDGNTFTYRVNRSDHNNEYGIYRTHIYAYDKAGNSISAAVDDVEVKEAGKADGADKLQLQGNSTLTLTDDGILTGLIQKQNTVKEIRQQFTTENIVIRNIRGEELGEDGLVGTGSTVNVMDGDTLKASCPVILAGDIDGDGKVVMKDVSMLARSLVGKETLSDIQKAAGDVRPDGKVVMKDVSMLARSLVGKEKIASQKAS